MRAELRDREAFGSYIVGFYRYPEVRTCQKIVSALGKYGIGLLVGSPASIGNILKDGLSPIPASIEIWVLVAPNFRGTQLL